MKLWIEAARPKTLIAGIAPVLIGSAMASTCHFWTFLSALCFAIALQVGTNYANDYFDCIQGTDTAARKGPRRMTACGLVSPTVMKRAMIIAFGTAALFGIALVAIGGPVIALLGIMAIALGIWYTAGDHSLSTLGLGDPIVFLFFGPIAVAGVTYLHTGYLQFASILAGIAPGALSTAILAVNNIRDHEEDALAGRETIPVRFGRKYGELEYCLLLVIAALVPPLIVLATGTHHFTLLASAAIVYGLPLARVVISARDLATLNPVLAKTGHILMLYTLVFSLTL